MSLVSVCTAILNKVKKYDCILHAQDVYEQLSKGQRSPPDIFVTVVKF